jgi:hypothetical protein
VTYSLAITGQRADYQFPPTAITNVSTTVGLQNVTLTDLNARPGAQQNAMRNGTQVLCQNRDGSQSWYVIDAERWTPNNPIMRAVGP